MLESLFDKIADLMPAILLKETTTHVFSYEFSEIFKNTFFTEHLRATASVSCIIYIKLMMKVGFNLDLQKLMILHDYHSSDVIFLLINCCFDLNLMLRFTKQEILTQYPSIISI